MNKIHKALFSLFAFFVGHEAYAAVACGLAPTDAVSSANTTSLTPKLGTTHCSSTSTNYYYADNVGTRYYKVTICTGCDSDYKITADQRTVGTCSFNVQYCDLCTACTNCTSTSWTTASNGINQSQTLARCEDKCTNTCSKTTYYRCLGGYYGTPTSTTTGCYVCPTSGGLTGTSVAGSNSKVENCYFPSGRSVTDSTGTYQFTSNCFYGS